jgi:hypothetical protein
MARGYTWVKDPKPPKNTLPQSKKDQLLAQVQAFVVEH